MNTKRRKDLNSLPVSLFSSYYVMGFLSSSPDSTTRQRHTGGSKEPVRLSRGKKCIFTQNSFQISALLSKISDKKTKGQQDTHTSNLLHAIESKFAIASLTCTSFHSLACRSMFLNWSSHFHWGWLCNLEAEYFGWVFFFPTNVYFIGTHIASNAKR